MSETTLDRMVRKSVKETLNAMPRYQRCMVHFERNVLARVTPATARSDGARAWSAASPTNAAR